MTPVFFQLSDAWYWRDGLCDEPIGPLNSKRAAIADHRAERVSPTATAALIAAAPELLAALQSVAR